MPYFDFKLNSVFVKNNRDINKAELQLFSFISTSDSLLNGGVFSNFLSANEKDKKDILRAATSELISTKQLLPLENIPDNFRMNFGINGMSLYRSHTVPEFLDWNFAIFESDEDIRQFGSKLDKLVDHASYNGFVDNLLLVIGATATPQIYAAAKLTQFITKVIAGELMLNKDDQVCVYCESFNKYENYPNLNLKGVDIDDLTQNCKISYSIFGAE